MNPAKDRNLIFRVLRGSMSLIGPFLGLIVVITLFSLLAGDNWRRYLSEDNLKSIGIQTVEVALCGVGMTLVIISGGIDLSVGAMLALTTIVTALVFNGTFWPSMINNVFRGRTDIALLTALAIAAVAIFRSIRQNGVPVRGIISVVIAAASGYFIFASSGPVAALLAGILMGLFAGMLNGTLITVTGVGPFIVTLGMMQVFRGLAELLAGGESVNVDIQSLRETWLFALMQRDPPQAISAMTVSPALWILAGAAVIAAILLHRTVLGRHIIAIGSNETAAYLSGIRVNQVKCWTYSIFGMLVGLAGVLHFPRVWFGDATAGRGLELDVIAAVVIGGGSLRGGQGSVIGTLIGAAIMSFMRNGCSMAAIPNSVQQVLIGSIIVLAVAIDEIRHGRLKRS